MSFGHKEWAAKADAEAAAKRAREAEKYADVMAAAGAPEDCQLVPFDCVLLRQWIMGTENEPAPWIVAASDSWLAERGLGAWALRPFGPSGPVSEKESTPT